MNGVTKHKHTPSGERPGGMEAQARKQDKPFSAADVAFEGLKQALVDPERIEMTHREIEDFVNVQGREVLRLLAHVRRGSGTPSGGKSAGGKSASPEFGGWGRLH